MGFYQEDQIAKVVGTTESEGVVLLRVESVRYTLEESKVLGYQHGWCINGKFFKAYPRECKVALGLTDAEYLELLEKYWPEL